MAGNTFGKLFKISTFGESHGSVIGVVIDGCPSNFAIDFQEVQNELSRRKPGQSDLVTPRNETDELEILSGIFEGKTTGAPICLVTRNKDFKSKDYTEISKVYRPSHSDFVYHKKYGNYDFLGGGRASARETWARVAAGAIAKQILQESEIEILGFVSQVYLHKIPTDFANFKSEQIESSIIRCPHLETEKLIIQEIEKAKLEGDSLGGIVSCIIKGCPIGLGEPVFDKLEADLAKAMLSINASKGFDIGSGFNAVIMKGSEHNDAFYMENESVKTKTNYSGGVQAGISNGMDIHFRVAFKPVSTIKKEQKTISKNLVESTISLDGRHDPCVVPRAVPIVEAMAAIVVLDHLLLWKSSQQK